MKSKKEYALDYYIRNKEYINAKRRLNYSDRDRDLAKLRKKTFEIKHGKEIYKKYIRKKTYYLEHKTKYPELYAKKILQNRLSRSKKYQSDPIYRKKEIARCNKYSLIRIHNARSSVYPITREIIDTLYEKYQHKCNNCSSTTNLSIDHIVSIKNGGTNIPTNLQILCMPCNRSKSWK